MTEFKMSFVSTKIRLSSAFKNNKKCMFMIIPVSFIAVILMSSCVMMNGYFVNDRNSINAYAAAGDDNNNSKTVVTTTATSALEGPDSANVTNVDIVMKQLLSSNKPVDIATLAYIWGYPLVTAEVTKDYNTNPNVPKGAGQGPVNQFHPARDLINASFKAVVRPNADTLYHIAWLDLKNGPLVLKIPDIANRYYVIPHLDAYGNQFKYIGSRTTGEKGGIYVEVGPNWKGTLPANLSNATKIQSPTNLVFIIGRILVNGPADVKNVHEIQDKITLTPVLQNATSKSAASVNSTTTTTITTTSTPILPTAENIKNLGISYFDIMSKSLADNPPPANQSYLIKKFETIGIGPGKIPSKDVTNQTIIQALKTGISEGEKLIDEKFANVGTIINGWSVNLKTGVYGEDYLLRAAVTKGGFGANAPQEAVYPSTLVDGNGTLLNAANNTGYIIHFPPGQSPPVKPLGFWSITMYDKDGFFVDNPINRYNIGDRTSGLKNNTDGSLDIYISSKNPGSAKESNWLPAPDGPFSLLLRMYVPQDIVVKGQYQVPPVDKVVNNK
jgi:hypothetical protein